MSSGPGSVNVAAIIPTYNRAGLIRQAVDSILGQTRPPDQLVVIDDGSTDDTQEVLGSYGNRISCRRQGNAGKSAALNQAMADIDADYLWIFDDDDVALPDALERHLALLQDNPEIDFTYSGCYLFEGDEPPASPNPKCLYDALAAPAASLFIRCLEVFPGHTGGMLVPLRCYRGVGPFDTRLTFGEDYEMMLRLVRHYRAARLPDPTFLIRQHPGPRGPAHERRMAADREAAWLPYERMTFLRLRRELALDDYLPANMTCGQDSALRRRALLQRACVMARHGLFQEALDDIGAAVVAHSNSAPFTDEERKICSRMLNVEPALLRGQGLWLASVRRLLKGQARPLLDGCVVGIGWRMRRELTRRSYRAAALMLWALWRLADLPTVPRMAQLAWSKSFKIRLAR